MARILGLDIGIGSCGWGVIDSEEVDHETGEVREVAVVACGARCFDVPEEPKTKELKNKTRRQLRGQRRVMRRRAQRIGAIRRLLAEHGMPADPGPLPAGTPTGRVWLLRAEALERPLEPAELSRVLIHLAKHRGFKSLSRRQEASNKGDEGKMLKAVSALDQRSAAWRTVGEMLARDPDFALRKRNTAGDYSHTLLRQRVEDEARAVFTAQRRLGSRLASEEVEHRYLDIAFHQRPLKSSVELVGRCRFEPTEFRSPRHAPSFERFRFLSRLNSLRVGEARRKAEALTAEQRAQATDLFATKERVNYKQLRRRLGLGDTIRFDGLPALKDPEGATLADFTGSVRLREALGGTRFDKLLAMAPEKLDAAMTAIVFHETDEEVEREIRATGLNSADVDALIAALDSFAPLRGAGHISSRACRNLLPHLEAGQVYSEACRLAGYDHTALGDVALDKIPNPVVRKVIGESLRQIKAIFRVHGEPELIHVEMARDIGRSKQEREEIRRGGEQRGADKERHREEYREAHGRLPNDEELERYELWKEQDHRCVYCDDGYISPTQLVATDNSVQVDHILPYSRSGDDSFRNKALVHAACNQQKRDRTLWEWFGESDPARWQALETRLGLLRDLHKEKKRKLLLKSFAEREDAYRARHLQDTRYAVRVLRMLIERHWPRYATLVGGERPIRTRPGAITAMVRRGLGLDKAKKSGQLGDRDHALDALIIAWTTDSVLQRLTNEAKRMEESAKHRHIPTLIADRRDKERLRQLFLAAAEAVFVSRPETRRGRGPAHDATLYGFDQTPDGEVQYERKAVTNLKPDDLDRLKGDPARNRPLREALAAWLAKAEAQGLKKLDKLFATDPPRMPAASGAGPVIRSLRLVRGRATVGKKILRGTGAAHVEKLEMARIDLFRVRERYVATPVLRWQIADKRSFPVPPLPPSPPRKKGDRGDTLAEPTFVFSLFPGSFFRAVMRDGTICQGYYRSYDRDSSRIWFVNDTDTRRESWMRLSLGQISTITKHHVDRLGARHLIEKEPREWRGEVCMSASAAG
jgi:CRISPR-associated endonuclease Csn1